ncbi:MAG: MBL fold metallo-hydrolase [Puniceicoccales bacterium]|jgi:Cft2 family RNA processing exonuclease|nr:MBL fold metallo-hydrolase [Puniceicoccales bacterium]
MYFKDLNSSKTIGANSLLVSIGSFNMVIDAGMDPKLAGLKALPNFDQIEKFSLDLVMVTHCHLDHIGSLPILLRDQPQARVLLSPSSRLILPIMLDNTITVMKHQRDERGIKEYPLYGKTEVSALEEFFIEMPNGRTKIFKKLNDEIRITFVHDGHICGASGVLIEHKHRKIFFSGDVLFRDQMTLPGALWPDEKLDVLVMETTRGNVERPNKHSIQQEINSLISRVNITIENGGSVLIPSFALGRMQEILSILNDAKKKKQLLKNVRIVCSGLGLTLIDAFDKISKKHGLINFKKSVLRDLNVKPLIKIEHLSPNQKPAEPTIFVVSSGMMTENTPSYNIAACLLNDSNNSICFVGYCDKDTPGGKLLTTAKGHSFFFDTLNKSIGINAHVEYFDLSGHAERDELLQHAIDFNPRAIVLTHGEDASREWFFDELLDRSPNIKIVNPDVGVEYNI